METFEISVFIKSYNKQTIRNTKLRLYPISEFECLLLLNKAEIAEPILLKFGT